MAKSALFVLRTRWCRIAGLPDREATPLVYAVFS